MSLKVTAKHIDFNAQPYEICTSR